MIDAPLTAAEHEALAVLAIGISSRAGHTVVDEARGLRAVQGSAASKLVARGLARDVPGWDAVELTPAGRAAIGERSQGSPGR
jgi:hypothetical protein